MTDIEGIKDAVQALRPSASAEFRRGFTEFDSAARARRIDADLASGGFDALPAEAEAKRDLKNLPARKPRTARSSAPIRGDCGAAMTRCQPMFERWPARTASQ